MNRKEFLVRVASCAALSAGAAKMSFANGENSAGNNTDKKPALLVIDLQNQYMPLMSETDRRTAPPVVNLAMGLFRSCALPVYTIYHTDLESGPTLGSEGFLFDPAIKTTDSDVRIVKNYPNAFKKTQLLEMLRKADCGKIFLCGLSATGCVLASYFGAQDLDYPALLIKGAILSPTTEFTNFIEDICGSVNLQVLQTILARFRPTNAVAS